MMDSVCCDKAIWQITWDRCQREASRRRTNWLRWQSSKQAMIFWDILEDNHQAKKIAHQHNSIPVRKLTRMFLSANAVKADPNFLYALADPAVG